MLIPKQKKKEPVLNPFRPKVGIPSPHSICKLSWGSYWVEPDVVVERVRVDADHNEEFIAEMEANIPREDRHRCHDHEVWLVDAKWKRLLSGLAKKYFDEVKVELRTW